MENINIDDFRITIKTQDGKTAQLTGRDLQIDPTNINDNLSKQPALYAWFATVHEMARTKREQTENELELLYSTLYREVKNNTAGMKVTEKETDSIIETNPKYVGMKKTLLGMHEQERIAAVARDAYSHRKDCLITLASNLRAQWDTELSIKAREAVDDLKTKRGNQS